MRRECRERFSRHRGLAIPTLKSVAGKAFPAFPAHEQPEILRIWWEAHENHWAAQVPNTRRTYMQDFTRIDASEKSCMQTIVFQFKRDVPMWKILKCPQRMQGTWRQTAVTPYTGFRVVYSYILVYIIYIIMSSVYLRCAPARCSLTEH